MFSRLTQGDQGLPGEVGAPGERGAGDPGAKVSQNSYQQQASILVQYLNFPIHKLTWIHESVSGWAGIIGVTWFAGPAGGRWSAWTEGSSPDHMMSLQCMCLLKMKTVKHACLCLQGEPGALGLRGPEGAPGIGTQGEKVKKWHFLLSFLHVSLKLYQVLPCVP